MGYIEGAVCDFVWWRGAPPHNNKGFGRSKGEFYTMSWRALRVDAGAHETLFLNF
jgi:hypothetical protein